MNKPTWYDIAHWLNANNINYEAEHATHPWKNSKFYDPAIRVDFDTEEDRLRFTTYLDEVHTYALKDILMDVTRDIVYLNLTIPVYDVDPALAPFHVTPYFIETLGYDPTSVSIQRIIGYLQSTPGAYEMFENMVATALDDEYPDAWMGDTEEGDYSPMGILETVLDDYYDEVVEEENSKYIGRRVSYVKDEPMELYDDWNNIIFIRSGDMGTIKGMNWLDGSYDIEWDKGAQSWCFEYEIYIMGHSAS